MEKKEYLKLELNVIVMSEEANILAGSDPTSVQFSDDSLDDGEAALSARQTGLWDDDEE